MTLKDLNAQPWSQRLESPHNPYKVYKFYYQTIYIDIKTTTLVTGWVICTVRCLAKINKWQVSQFCVQFFKPSFYMKQIISFLQFSHHFKICFILIKSQLYLFTYILHTETIHFHIIIFSMFFKCFKNLKHIYSLKYIQYAPRRY